MVFCLNLEKGVNQTVIKNRQQDNGCRDGELRIMESIKSNAGKDFLVSLQQFERVRDFGEFKGFRL